MVTANNVLDMLTANWNTIQKHYSHIAEFSLEEVQNFLNGKEVNPADTYTRNHQVRQAISAVGAVKVDAKLADNDTVVVYKALWATQKECKCTYCKKPFTYNLMLGKGGSVCSKSRCQSQYMRDSI